MVEENRVSVKFLVLDSLKGKIIDGERWFPLYTQVVFKSKNTKFKTTINKKSVLVKADFDQNNNVSTELAKSLKEHALMIENIVTYENDRFKNDFTLKGLQNRVAIYSENLVTIFNQFTPLLDPLLKANMIYNDYEEFQKLISPKQKIFYLINYDKEKGTQIFQEKNIGLMALVTCFLFESYLNTFSPNKHVTCYDWLIEGQDKIYDLRAGEIKEHIHEKYPHLISFWGIFLDGRKYSSSFTFLLETILGIYLK